LGILYNVVDGRKVDRVVVFTGCTVVLALVVHEPSEATAPRREMTGCCAGSAGWDSMGGASVDVITWPRGPSGGSSGWTA
ncbi:hypothetical protein, partial [Streptomyces toxytricini]|uniref:hypothetical protein n=1 Tax=Streptomyces toxytricini TaxID=67369 RepID=UPI003435818F